MRPLKIMLVDDHPIVRAGFRQLLELEPGWKVVAEAGSAQELAACLLHTRCHVLVLDLSLPDADGLVMLRQLRTQRPELTIVVMTMHHGSLYVQEALSAGAAAFVTKSSPAEELVEAVRRAAAGKTYLSTDVREMAAATDMRIAQFQELTVREQQVFLLLARGHSVARVASTIGISAKTTYSHRTSLHAKLKLSSDYDLRMLAVQMGLVPPA